MSHATIPTQSQRPCSLDDAMFRGSSPSASFLLARSALIGAAQQLPMVELPPKRAISVFRPSLRDSLAARPCQTPDLIAMGNNITPKKLKI